MNRAAIRDRIDYALDFAFGPKVPTSAGSPTIDTDRPTEAEAIDFLNLFYRPLHPTDWDYDDLASAVRGLRGFLAGRTGAGQ